jgi:hypothetical protein
MSTGTAGVRSSSMWAVKHYLTMRHRFIQPHAPCRERGDVSGWVLVTLMTAGLVITLSAVAGPRLEGVFNDAMDRVMSGP